MSRRFVALLTIVNLAYHLG